MNAIRAKRLFQRYAGEISDRISADRERVIAELQPILAEIEERWTDPRFSIVVLRRQGKFTRVLRGLFREELGETPSSYLRRQRLDAAELALRLTEIPTSLVAQLAGFSHPSNLSRDFKRKFERSPRQYRRDHRSKEAGDRGDPRQSLDYWLRTLWGTRSAEEYRRLIPWVVTRLRLSTRGNREADPPSPLVTVRPGEFLADKAADVCRALLALPHEERLMAVSNQIRFEPPELFEELRKRSRLEGRHDRRRGIELAELALTSVEAASTALGEEYESRLAVAWAVVGNSHRLAEDFPAAEAAFRNANEILEAGGANPLAEAEVHLNEGTLRLFQRRFLEAESLLDLAIALACAFDSPRLFVLALLERVSLLTYRGEYATALSELEGTIWSVETLKDEQLEHQVHQAVAGICAYSGKSKRGWEALAAARRLCEPEVEPISHLQLTMIEGMLLEVDGQVEGASERLAAAREGFARRGARDHAGATSLELAVIRHRQGRYGEAARLAAEAIPLFQALRIERDALVAAELLRQSIAAGELSRRILVDARNLLRRLQQVPP